MIRSKLKQHLPRRIPAHVSMPRQSEPSDLKPLFDTVHRQDPLVFVQAGAVLLGSAAAAAVLAMQ